MAGTTGRTRSAPSARGSGTAASEEAAGAESARGRGGGFKAVSSQSVSQSVSPGVREWVTAVEKDRVSLPSPPPPPPCMNVRFCPKRRKGELPHSHSLSQPIGRGRSLGIGNMSWCELGQ